MSADLEARIAALTPVQQIVLLSVDEEFWRGFQWIADDTKVPLPEVKETVRELHRLRLLNYGLLNYGPLTNSEEQVLAGRGYWAVAGTYRAMADLREQADDWARFGLALICLLPDEINNMETLT